MIELRTNVKKMLLTATFQSSKVMLKKPSYLHYFLAHVNFAGYLEDLDCLLYG
jgi:hypothetical protein